MLNEQSNFVKVANLSELAEGKPKAVKVEGQSVALFQHNGCVYATDNQCPHMGYPLTRGRVRNGVLTCDWHGWSYDMGGGGCFTGGCDDLATFPVDVRNGSIYIDVGSGGKKRDDAHFLLLKEGMLSADNWTLSKAVAIMLAKGVSEEETLNLLVKHMGRHIATEREGGDGGRQLALMINGVKVARQYDPDDRLIPLMMAAQGASGRAGDRPAVQPLPHPVSWEKLEKWIRVFSADREWEGIEKCLITARRLGGHDDQIIPLLYECAVEPFFLGHTDNLLHLGYLTELLEEFGWEVAEELVCNLAAKMLGRGRGAPDEVRREAIRKLESLNDFIDELASHPPADVADFDEDGFAAGLVSGDLYETFDAITNVLKAGVDINRIATTMVLIGADRMARTPASMSPGWGGLGWEINLSSSIRTAFRYAGFKVAAKALYHVAWQFFSDRWLNIRTLPLTEPRGTAKSDAPDEDTALQEVLDLIEAIGVHEVGRQTRQYLNAGFSGDRLLSEMGQCILRDDNGWDILHTLRTVFNEWKLCKGHPARNQLLVGLSRWTTDVRKRTGSDSAARTAQRFARGQTAVDLY
ncbi:Rieske (2Fe-2S) protein [Candidatus Poribacteria bacterium]|nr:Rieske (2Fe-2S) protein [Candidatus Poribacteria bacterium]